MKKYSFTATNINYDENVKSVPFSWIDGKTSEIKRGTYGCACEVALQKEMGVIVHKDSIAYNYASDIDDYKISVKSGRFSLMDRPNATDFDGIVAEYVANTHSHSVAYSIMDTHSFETTTYFMTIEEFIEFLSNFALLSRNSSSRGGNAKIRGKNPSKKMRDWLDSHAEEDTLDSIKKWALEQ